MSLNPINPYKAKLELISLIQAIPEDSVLSVKNLLESILSQSIDPTTIALLTAPIDTEPLTEEEERNIQESLEAYAKGDVINFEDFAKELPDGE